MKNYFLPLLLATALWTQESEPSYWDFHPLHAGGNVIALGQADVKIKNGPSQGELTFNKENLFVSMLVPVSRTSYFFPRVEWNTFSMDWNQNPKFNETRFNYVQFALTFLSIALDKWRWIARGEYNIDTKHFSEAKEYGLFSALLWGTHEISDKLKYHVGAFGYTGFEGSTVYPIIGIDYTYEKKWFFQAVFPITYSIEYIFNEQWRLGLKGRPLKERFRTGENEPQPRSVFCYSTMGAELNLHYEKFLRCEAEVFMGYNAGGTFYIKDHKGDHSLYTNVESSPYLGASFNWGF